MRQKIIFPDYIPLMTFKPMKAQFVATLGHAHKGRNMILSEFNTRCIQKGEIHELVCLKKEEQGTVNFKDAWYLGFIEFNGGGVLAKGMTLEVNEQIIGTLVGFDDTHTPNHYNLLISTENPKTGPELGIKVGDSSSLQMTRKS